MGRITVLPNGSAILSGTKNLHFWYGASYLGLPREMASVATTINLIVKMEPKWHILENDMGETTVYDEYGLTTGVMDFIIDWTTHTIKEKYQELVKAFWSSIFAENFVLIHGMLDKMLLDSAMYIKDKTITEKLLVDGDWDNAINVMINSINDFHELRINVKEVSDLDTYFKRYLGSSLADELPTKQEIFEYLFNSVDWQEEIKERSMKQIEYTVGKDIPKILGKVRDTIGCLT